MDSLSESHDSLGAPRVNSPIQSEKTPKAFVALPVFWLTLLFASVGLLALPNSTSAITLALRAAGMTA
jgi:hypothetical protein